MSSEDYDNGEVTVTLTRKEWRFAAHALAEEAARVEYPDWNPKVGAELAADHYLLAATLFRAGGMAPLAESALRDAKRVAEDG